MAFDGEERVYVSLHRDAHVDVWLLCWTPENDTGWHDHDVSSGAVAVVAGELVENNLTLAHGARETQVPAGRVFSFGPDHIHRLNGAVHGSISVHAYSPPLWRMGQYAVSDAGVLRRVSLSYADELRPIDDPEPSTASPRLRPMPVESFGPSSRGPVQKIVLGSPPGPVLEVLDLGATVHRLWLTGGDGVRRNVVLGHATAEEYLTSKDYVGAHRRPLRQPDPRCPVRARRADGAGRAQRGRQPAARWTGRLRQAGLGGARARSRHRDPAAGQSRR